MEYFVGIACDDTSGNGGGDVYRVVTASAWDRDIGGSNTASNVTGLDGVGGVGSAYMLAVGSEAESPTKNRAWRSDDNGSTWDEDKKRPTGYAYGHWPNQALPSVVVAPDYADSGEAWVATIGNNCAISRTTTYGKYFSQISLIETEIERIIDLAVSPDWGSSGALFMITQDWDSDSSPDLYLEGDDLWRHDGDHWERVYHRSLLTGGFDSMDYVQVSPEWVDDNTVCFVDSEVDQAYRSTNGGDHWVKTLAAVPQDSYGWLVIDKNTRIVGVEGGTRLTKNNATTWGGKKGAGTSPIVNFALDPNNSDNILCSNMSGNVYLSTNGGGKWTIQPDAGSELPGDFLSFVAFDPNFASNNFIYAADFDGEVWRCSTETSTSWTRISDRDDTWPELCDGPDSIATASFRDIQVGPDGVLYVVDLGDEGDVPVARCVNPEAATEPADYAPFFETIDKSWPSDDPMPFGLWLVPGSSNTLFTINWSDAEIWAYTDEVTAPVLSSPANNTSSLRVDEVTLKWQSVTNATRYCIMFSRDVDFATYWYGFSTSETFRAEGLRDGTAYYWRVAVFTGKPCLSDFSTTWKFTTQLSEAQWNPFVGGIPEAPYNGATDVPLTPSFAWNAADWATGYEFELADNPGFSPTIKSFRGAGALDTTVFLLDEALANSTTYYWRVRAVNATSQSEWANGVFTTMAAAPAPPAPPPPAPTPPAPIVPPPAIPTYLLWTIIGVGALLVIAVIILIVKTRARI
jgi:hypothetical protein